MAAARALGRRGSAAAIDGMLARIRAASLDDFDDEDETESECLVGAIVAAAGQGGEIARASVITGLGSRFDGASETFRLAMGQVLARIGTPRERRLIERLLSDPSDRVRRAATTAMVKVGDDGIESLRFALADEAATVRIGAVTALGALGAPDFIADLRVVVDDEDLRVRAAVMRAIGAWIEAAPAAPEAAFALLGDGVLAGGPVAMAAIESLAQAGGTACVSLASPGLEDSDSEIVHSAVTCIARHGSRDELRCLFPLFEHDAWAVRACAIQAAADRRVATAMPSILRRLENEDDEFVRETALRALAALERLAG